MTDFRDEEEIPLESVDAPEDVADEPDAPTLDEAVGLPSAPVEEEGEDLLDTPLHEAEGSVLGLDDEGLEGLPDLYEDLELPPTDEEWDELPETPELEEGNEIETEDEELRRLDEDTFSTEDLGPVAAAPTIRHYEVQARTYEEQPWETIALVEPSDEMLEVTDLPVGETWSFRIRTVFTNGEASAWSAPSPVIFPEDMLAPGIPSAPVVVGNAAGIGVTWDGLDESGRPMPPDFARVIIWQSPTGEDGTFERRASIPGAMEAILTGYDANEPHYFAFTAMDFAGNESGFSEIASGYRIPLVDVAELKEELDTLKDTDTALIEATGDLTTAFEDMAGRQQVAEDDISAAEQRISDAEAALAETATSSSVANLDETLRQAFGEDLAQAKADAAADAQAKADAAQAAAEAEADRLAKAEAQAAQSAAEATAAAVALAKANAARDAAIASAAADATSKADAAKTAAEAAAAADAKAKADAAQAEAIRQAKEDATTKANAAKADAEAAAKAYTDQQDVILKGEAAADAQAKADEARAHAEKLASKTGNLAWYGDFEGSVEETFRTNPTARWGLVETSDAYRGSYVLQYEHTTAQQQSTYLASVPVTPGRFYRVGFWVRLAEGAPGTTGSISGGFGQLWQRPDGTTYNSSNYYSVWGAANFTAHLSSEWTYLEGVTEAPGNVSHMLPRLYFYNDTVDVGSVVHFDELVIQDVTEAKAALDAAEVAQSKADEAHQDAGEAWTHADAAMSRAGEAETNAKTHADNLPKVLHGTTAPSGTAPNGSIWFRHQTSLSGAVIGQWNRVNNAWVSTPITSEVIANLDVGKLTAGSANLHTGVVSKLYAGIVEAKKAEIITLIAQDLIANNADIVSAAVKSLTVAEKASLVEAYVDELHAKLAIVDHLKAQSAWIDDDLLVDGTIKTRSLENTGDILTDALKARKIQGVDIDGDTFTGNTFQGGLFQGAVVQGGTVQTHEAPSRGIKLTNSGIFGYDYTGSSRFFLSATTGNMTSHNGTISGAMITGGTVQTDATLYRGVKMTSDGLKAYSNSGRETVNIDASSGDIFLDGGDITGFDITGSTLRLGPRFLPGASGSQGLNITTDGHVFGYDSSGNIHTQLNGSTNRITGELRTSTETGNAVTLGPNIYRGRPGIRLDTGSSDQLQPVIQSLGAGSDGFPAGSFVLNGRETRTNETGRTDLVLEHGGDFALKQSYGTNSGLGLHKNGRYVHIRGRLEDAGLAQIRATQSTGGRLESETSSIRWDQTYGTPVPAGMRLVIASPYYTHSTAYAAAKVGVNRQTASAHSVTVSERTTGITWRYNWVAIWV